MAAPGVINVNATLHADPGANRETTEAVSAELAVKRDKKTKTRTKTKDGKTAA